MLQAMQQAPASASSSPSPSFAGLLAALTAPAQKPGAVGDESLRVEKKRSAARSEAWRDDGLLDDIATLSYEQALRAHARYKAIDQPFMSNGDPAGDEQHLAASAEAPETVSSAGSDPPSAVVCEPKPNSDRIPLTTAFERNLKTASVTIRLSHMECAQLHRRAAEAGLTVSAYLRSCTFEAESLRTLVKDTLAELRLAKAQLTPAAHTPLRRAWFRRLASLLTPWHGGQRIARA